MGRPALALLPLLLAACRAPEPEPPPSPAPPPEQAPSEFDEAQWRAEAEQVLFDRHMRTAEAYRDALDVEEALRQVDRALALKPTSGKAMKLRADLQRMAGVRAGEVQTILEDEWQARLAREEQRLVEARRLLNEAREAEAMGDFERAEEAYKRAIYLAREAQ